jgi:arabinose-5-phosphate isomerase
LERNRTKCQKTPFGSENSYFRPEFSKKLPKVKNHLEFNSVTSKKTKLILEIARKTINIERDALFALENSLNSTFSMAIQAIFDAKTARIVVTGIGKSAIVAQKIAATFNSTGQPALFMHAADAIHGDLGMIQPKDKVLILSKSGETAEIKVLLPLVKNLGNQIIGVSAVESSFLAKQSDFFLHTPIVQEADPNNLAPTTSTTVQMALGDAIAVCLLSLRGFSMRDFSKFHPGGALGKQLYLRVRDLYILNEKPSVSIHAPLREIIHEMTSKRLGATAVLNEQNQLAGIITDGDLRRMMEKTNSFEPFFAQNILNSNPKTIEKDELAVAALEKMRHFSILQLIVLDTDSTYLGMIHLHDLLKEGLI